MIYDSGGDGVQGNSLAGLDLDEERSAIAVVDKNGVPLIHLALYPLHLVENANVVAVTAGRGCRGSRSTVACMA